MPAIATTKDVAAGSARTIVVPIHQHTHPYPRPSYAAIIASELTAGPMRAIPLAVAKPFED